MKEEIGMRRVFISIQTTLNAHQQLMLDHIYTALRELALAPIRMNNNSKGYDPLPELRQLMLSCKGALIIALERFRCASGVEYPDSTHAISFVDYRSSTVWNHIEAAMAYQAGLPILVLEERGLSRGGLLDKHLGSLKVVEFSLSECRNTLPEAVRRSLYEWSSVVG